MRTDGVKTTQKKLNGMTAAFILAGSLLLLFIILPLLSTLFGTEPAFLRETLTDPAVRSAIAVTFSAAAIATLLAALTGIPLAYLLARYDFRGKVWVEGLVNLPIVVPHTAAGVALLMVFGRQAPLGKAFGAAGLRFVDALPGVVIGMLFVSLPFLVNAAREAFAAIDPELESVAHTMGASHWQTFIYITLPLAWRGVLAGAVMMWGRGISEFGAVVILAYNPKIIPVLVYERFAGFGLRAAQPVAVVLIVASLLVFALIQGLTRRRVEE
ncbi:MAG: ABC transporter permease [Anaerolineales bacterium]|nr:ABC transporter permease [Anaerolineales bacterium]